MSFAFFDLGILFVFAIIGGIVASKTKLPPALGLILVGTLIGPSMFGLVKTEGLDPFVELGALLLLFITGLEFEASKISKIGFRASIAAVLKIGIVFFTTYHATKFIGYDAQVAAMLGIILSFSSTIVIVKILQQNEMYSRRETPFLIGILIAEDVLAILVLAFFDAAKTMTSIGAAYATIEHIIFAFIVLIALYLIGAYVLPALIKWVLHNSNEEAILFIDLAICAVFSAIAYYFGLSPSIGAFLGGSLIASLPNAHTFERAIAPFSLFFSSIFFLAMGTLVNVKTFGPNMLLIGVTLVVLLFSRLIGIGLVTNIFANFKQEEAVFSSLAMFSVGEFSLLIARHTRALNPGVDLISLTAMIIFISSIVMALTIKKSAQGTMLIKNASPPLASFFYNKLSRLSDYLNHGFQELATESTYTKKMKKNLLIIGSCFILLFLTLYFWNPLMTGIGNKFGQSLATLVLVFIVAYFIFQIALSIKEAFVAASITFSNIQVDRNRWKAGEIIILLFLFFMTFVIGLYLPFFITIFSLGTTWNIASITIFILSLVILVRLIFVIESCYSYQQIIPFHKRPQPKESQPFPMKKVKEEYAAPSRTKFRWKQ